MDLTNFSFTGFVCFYFAVFLLLSVVIYYLFPKKIRYYVLLVFSVAFYCLISWKSIFFLLYSILLNFFAAIWMERLDSKGKKYLAEHKEDLDKESKKAFKTKVKNQKKAILIVAIILNILVLFLMKYLDFLTENINGLISLFGGEFQFKLNHWILPLGISFFTFQSIGYIVDVYWGKIEAESNFFKFSLFMSYFPKIMQGPIVRYEEMRDEFFNPKDFDYVTFTNGAKRMGYGYLKKLVVADTLAVFVNYAFGGTSLGAMSGLETFLAVFFYFIQDYCDFSGYMDIAIGVSEMHGIKLPENFARPYFALTIDEYWRRWHITLGTWFKDYVYYPLSISKPSLSIGKRAKKKMGSFGMKIPAILGLIIVWLLTGLWHGASWNYVLWGLYYGVIIILSICFEPLFNLFYEKTHIKRDNVFIKIFQHIRTIFILIVGRILFIAPSLPDAWATFVNMFHFADASLSTLNNQLGYISIIMAFVGFVPVLVIDLIQERNPTTPFLTKFNKLPIALRWGLMIVMTLFIIWCGYYGRGTQRFEFGYVQF